jgi:hypothetical protein
MLMLSADDGVHAVAYDAVIVQVTDAIQLRAIRAGTNIQLNWSGGSAPFDIESTPGYPVSSWNHLLTTDAREALIPVANDRQSRFDSHRPCSHKFGEVISLCHGFARGTKTVHTPGISYDDPGGHPGRG